MIAVWMLYCLGIGVALSVVGCALERALHYAGYATRWAWVIAMIGSYLIPVAAWVRPEAFATFAAPIPVATEFAASSSITTSITSTNLVQPPARPFSLTDLDRPLRWAWMIASLALALFVGAGARRLIALRRRWRQANVDGRHVLISPTVGPAVVGVWSPSVVLPEWALEVSERERELMFAHEEQHMRAADPALNALGFLLILVAPWNGAIWWQWRRLRLAVEVDCDARVLAEGRSAAGYADLLLRVGQRARAQLVSVAAFGEPVSFLESRIRRMVAGVPRWRWVGAAAAVVVAFAAIVVACETPRPLGPAGQVADALASSQAEVRNNQVFPESTVDERPDYLYGPLLTYPELLRRAGVEGRVLLQAIIDSTGRAEPASIKVLSSPNAGFNESARQWLVRALFRPARVHGHAVRVLINIPSDFTVARKSSGPTSLSDRMVARRAGDLRPWVETSARRMMPVILEPSGPSMDAFLVHDSKLQVYRTSLVTLYYLNGKRPDAEIGVAALRNVLPAFTPGHDGWGVLDPRGLQGLVRDNVRVIRINHDPQPQDTSPRSADGPSADDLRRSGDQVRRLARQYHPEMFGRRGTEIAIALVLDSRDRVVAHAAATGEDRAANGMYRSGESCDAVLERLVPTYKHAQWSQGGCATDPQRNIVIYWGKLLRP